MRSLWGYSDFLTLLEKQPGIKNGIVLDTNVLIAATYDFDEFHEQTNDLLDLIVDNEIPLYCNVNVRAEFLEIQRRIIFTEALLSLEAATKRSNLPADLAKKLASIRANQSKREADGRQPLRLGEKDLKEIKLAMIQEETSKGNLWLSFTKEYVGAGLVNAWSEVEKNLGLNFLSTRSDDSQTELVDQPRWEDAVDLMTSEGLSSSDAMIVNMFKVSKFEAILSGDSDIGLAVALMKSKNKICFLPDRVLKRIPAP